MGCVSQWPMRLKAKWGIERNNYCFSKIQLVGQKNIDKTSFSSKARFKLFLAAKHYKRGQWFSLLVGYCIKPRNSSTNQNAALIIEH